MCCRNTTNVFFSHEFFSEEAFGDRVRSIEVELACNLRVVCRGTSEKFSRKRRDSEVATEKDEERAKC